jgi:23S rRNA pseudouridine1911/1915/1917 synthase
LKQLLLTAGPGDAAERLDRFLAKAGGISRGEARRLLERGSVWVDGKRVKAASRALRPGQAITLVLEEAGRRQQQGHDALDASRILYEDAHLVAVDKPPFVPAQPTLASDRDDLLALASALTGCRLGLVHRLDSETSGVTLFAKTEVGVLTQAFRERRVHKRYLALVMSAEALPDEGVIDLAISSDPTRPGRQRAIPKGKLPALTRFRCVERCRAGTALVEAFPETGRTHQIRAHLEAMGAPLLGDKLYGGLASLTMDGTDSNRIAIPRVMLHASAIELEHPATRKPLRIEAPLPEDFGALLVQVR